MENIARFNPHLPVFGPYKILNSDTFYCFVLIKKSINKEVVYRILNLGKVYTWTEFAQSSVNSHVEFTQLKRFRSNGFPGKLVVDLICDFFVQSVVYFPLQIFQFFIWDVICFRFFSYFLISEHLLPLGPFTDNLLNVFFKTFVDWTAWI